MINTAFIKDGQITHYGSPGDDDDYQDGEMYDGCLCKHFSVDVNLAEFSRVNYWDGTNWQTRVSHPTPYYDWATTNWSLDTERLHIDIRSIRNDLLLKTDFTQVADAPLTTEKKAEWATYRQELRDFMENVPADLDDVVDIPWPTQPS